MTVVGDYVSLLTCSKFNVFVCFEVLGYFEVHIPVVFGITLTSLSKTRQEHSAFYALTPKFLVSRGGNKSKQFTTTNLQNYVQSKQPLCYRALSVKDKVKVQRRTCELSEQHGETSGRVRKPLKSQMTLQVVLRMLMSCLGH